MNTYISQAEARELRDATVPPVPQAALQREGLLGANLLDTLILITERASRKGGMEEKDRALASQFRSILSNLIAIADAQNIEYRGSTIFADGQVVTRLAGVERNYVCGVAERFGISFGKSMSEGNPFSELGALIEIFIHQLHKREKQVE